MRPRRVRPWWERAAALCAAVWFLVAALDLPALHTCAMHGGAPATAMAALMGHGAHAGSHRASPADSSAHSHGSVPAHDGHACTCLGACCAAVGAPPPAPPAVAAAPLTRVRVAAPGRPAHEYVAAWVDFVLPFSTAPPAVPTA